MSRSSPAGAVAPSGEGPAGALLPASEGEVRTRAGRTGGPVRLVREMVYSALSLPLGVLVFLLTVLGVVIGSALALTVVGVPITLACLAVVRTVARVERARAGAVLRVAAPAPRRVPPTGGPFSRLRTRWRDRQTWRDVGCLLLSLPLGALEALVLLGSIALLARGVVWPFLAWGHPSFYTDAWGGPTLAGAMMVHCLPGLLVVVLGPWILHRITTWHAGTVHRMLGPRSPG